MSKAHAEKTLDDFSRGGFMAVFMAGKNVLRISLFAILNTLAFGVSENDNADFGGPTRTI